MSSQPAEQKSYTAPGASLSCGEGLGLGCHVSGTLLLWADRGQNTQCPTAPLWRLLTGVHGPGPCAWLAAPTPG